MAEKHKQPIWATKPKHSLRFWPLSVFFFPPQSNNHQFLTHVNGPFQYFMFLYGVLTIERRNGRRILPQQSCYALRCGKSQSTGRRMRIQIKDIPPKPLCIERQTQYLVVVAFRSIHPCFEIVFQLLITVLSCKRYNLIVTWYRLISLHPCTDYLYTLAPLKVNSLSGVINCRKCSAEATESKLKEIN